MTTSRARSDGRLGVFARELRCRRLVPLFVTLEPCFARPGAVEVVAHTEPQTTKALRFELDRIAVEEWVQPAMVGARSQNVAGLEGVDGSHPFNTARDLVRHVVSVEALHQRAVVPQFDRQLVWVGNLV